LIALLDTKAAKLKSSTLMALATSIRADPLKKVRIMIQNLIKRLQDETENELKRHQDCDQKETALQDERKNFEMLDHVRMNTPGEGAFYQIAQSVIRAIRLCNPIKNLPTTSYEKWKTMILRFNPIEMMGG
jgi:hypothetical protein